MPSVSLKADVFSGAKILVVSPHADDEIFGCGGTIAKAKAEGAEVNVMLISIADVSHFNRVHPHVKAEQRLAEFHQAMEILRVDRTDVLFQGDAYDLRLDKLPRRDLMTLIEKSSPLALENSKPDILLFPAVSYHQDHEAVYLAVYAACRPHLPTDKHFVPIVLSYDQPQLGWNHYPFRPNVYVDISAYLETKLKAYRCHVSQIRSEPHHSSIENVERLARLRGSEVSVPAAEAFECHRWLIH